MSNDNKTTVTNKTVTKTIRKTLVKNDPPVKNKIKTTSMTTSESSTAVTKHTCNFVRTKSNGNVKDDDHVPGGESNRVCALTCRG